MSLKTEKQNVPSVYASRTDVGNVREHNEDSLAIDSPLFVVADGMGGHEAGEVASAIAADTMLKNIPESPDAEALAQAVRDANEAVLRGAEDGTGKPGMGTTLTAALVYGDQLIVAQVGDSRAYLFHNGSLQRITRDHSLVADLIEQGRITEEEAHFHPQRSVITRALGSDPNMEPDLFTLTVVPGDVLMLCSDGLSSMISDESIEAILRNSENPEQACDSLVSEALAAGGHDNVTTIVVDLLAEDGETEVAEPVMAEIAEEPAEPEAAEPVRPEKAAPKPNMLTAEAIEDKKARRKGRRAPLIWAIVFVIILAAAGGGFYAYAQNSYYLITEDGYVTVYRGLPGEAAGLKFSWLEEKTDIPAAKLNPTVASRLERGIAVDNIDAAKSLINDYRQQLDDTDTSKK